MPISCHRVGKLLPLRWQSFAKPMARSCQYGGKNTLLYPGISRITIRILLHKHQTPVSGLLRTF
ncbi:hypothetical protein DXB65_20540 [Bacteroides oleiciplenus]|uniref:Uncharacterized protein n=1 Tax=Bacteroides oleiciplenus TaxID=626931 RepID=A0A3E5B1K5_9BACE|nr:hypothetical protein DXB65_20540 [Bacteroides oleiciplenus]